MCWPVVVVAEMAYWTETMMSEIEITDESSGEVVLAVKRVSQYDRNDQFTGSLMVEKRDTFVRSPAYMRALTMDYTPEEWDAYNKRRADMKAHLIEKERDETQFW